MDYSRELKKYLAKKMAKVDGVYDEEVNLLQELHPDNILKQLN